MSHQPEVVSRRFEEVLGDIEHMLHFNPLVAHYPRVVNSEISWLIVRYAGFGRTN